MEKPDSIKSFIDSNFQHFNSASLKDAAAAYSKHIGSGGKMFLAMAGAMSTAEIGKTLAEMIRQGKIHAISCTGANLEEDLFNLIAHNDYEMVPNYQDLTPQDELRLFKSGLNRVTDTCIPEEKAMRKFEKIVIRHWKAAQEKGERKFPHEFFYDIIRAGDLEQFYQIDPKDSWMLAAAEKNLPIFVPGWEDSTIGNVFVAENIKGNLKGIGIMKTGFEYMQRLVEWYSQESEKSSIGFFQIGGGISGDFPICVVPLINQDAKIKDVPSWGYFCQISDSTTSYGSYSGAVPNEKITWGKLNPDTPRFMIESDATIVAPLIFAYVLGW
ncbi:MAG: deoxyhypusine synthase family protein [Candidatus Micrarchaeia archaeon]